jgi:hypothetical protein
MILANKPRPKEKGRDEFSPRRGKHIHELVAIVIVVIPIAIGMPAVAVFVPPAMPLAPATFPRLMQFVPRMVRLPAVPAVMLHGFVEFVVRLGNAALATAVVICESTGRSGEGRQADERRRSKHCLSEKLFPSRLKLHILSILPFSPLAGMGEVLSYETP